MVILGPIIFGLLMGLIIGSQIRLDAVDVNFTLTSFILIIISGVLIAWQLGQFPFYGGIHLSTGFLIVFIIFCNFWLFFLIFL